MKLVLDLYSKFLFHMERNFLLFFKNYQTYLHFFIAKITNINSTFSKKVPKKSQAGSKSLEIK